MKFHLKVGGTVRELEQTRHYKGLNRVKAAGTFYKRGMVIFGVRRSFPEFSSYLSNVSRETKKLIHKLSTMWITNERLFVYL